MSHTAPAAALTDVGEKLIRKAAYRANTAIELQMVDREAGRRESKATAIAMSRLEGLADAADVLGVATTPTGFLYAVINAIKSVGTLNVPTVSSRERAAQIRAQWTDAVYKATISLLM